MTNQVIPEAAVEAAARGIVASLPNDADFEIHRTWAMGYARAALEAAAPHLLREAWFEGFSTGMEYGEWWAGSSCTAPEPDNSNSNPYGGRA